MAIQLSEAFASFSRLKKDVSDINSAIFIEWCDFINKFAYRIVTAIDPERYITAYTLTALTGNNSYTLPTDFRDIKEWGTGIYINTPTGSITEGRLARTNFGSQIRGYYISGNNIILTPTPVRNETYTLRYIPKVTALTLIDQYFTQDGTTSGKEVIPDEYMMYVRSALDAQYTVWDEEVGAESYADARFVRSLDELARNLRKESAVYGMPDFSVIF